MAGTILEHDRALIERVQSAVVNVAVWRKGKQHELDVSIARSPEVTMAETGTPLKAAEGPRLGLALAAMTEELRQRYDVPGGVDGALVVEIEPGNGLGLSLVEAVAKLHQVEPTMEDNGPGLRATLAFERVER